MANEFKVRKGLIVQGSGSIILDIQGSQGELFSVTDSLSGSLFSVNDISGIPIMEVFSDNTIKMGTFNNEAIIVSGSRTGMGIATPQAKLHISGANNDSLFRIQSPTSASIMFVSGSGNVGIGTNLPSAELHISGASTDSLLRVGSPTNANILFVTGSGRVGIGTSIPTNALTVSGTIESLPVSTDEGGQLTLRAATGRSFRWNVDNYQDNFRIFRENDSDSSGGVVRILISGSSGNIGIQTSTPTDWIHLSSDPANNKYLRIDATQFSTSPTEQSGTPDTAIGQSANTNKYLTEPDYWMEIVLGAAGGIVLVPCYIKG